MATRMWLAAYAGATRAPGRLRVRALGLHASPARGILSAVDGGGLLHQIEPIQGALAEWDLAIGAGPILTFQTPAGPVTIGPTRLTEFHLALVTAAADPEEPVIVSLRRDGRPLTAAGPHDNGGVVADQEVETPGKSLDLYLEA